jgi:hypothetical protein
MCEFISFYVSDDCESIYPGDLRSYSECEMLHGLWLGEVKQPVPVEWTEDGLTARPYVNNTHDAAWYADKLRARFSTRDTFLRWCVQHLPHNLTELNLYGCSSVTDLSPLAGLTSLTVLNLSGCSSVTDLSPLAGLTSLTVYS